MSVDDIPESGMRIEIDAPAATLAELKEIAAVREIERVTAAFNVTRNGARVHVAGEVKAKVGQTCVVTLEPIETEVAEAVDVTFAPAPAGASAAKEIDVRPDREPPEPLLDGKVDLGRLATEYLVLGIDPYPRKAGATFVPPKVETKDPNPFAALEALKKPAMPPGGKQS
ncbi:MAG: DUF177 domain-containing protein [Pseudolabrys sp.]